MTLSVFLCTSMPGCNFFWGELLFEADPLPLACMHHSIWTGHACKAYTCMHDKICRQIQSQTCTLTSPTLPIFHLKVRDQQSLKISATVSVPFFFHLRYSHPTTWWVCLPSPCLPLPQWMAFSFLLVQWISNKNHAHLSSIFPKKISWQVKLQILFSFLDFSVKTLWTHAYHYTPFVMTFCEAESSKSDLFESVNFSVSMHSSSSPACMAKKFWAPTHSQCQDLCVDIFESIVTKGSSSMKIALSSIKFDLHGNHSFSTPTHNMKLNCVQATFNFQPN